ncbi:MAG TPA: hypothetical protein VGJ20_43455 [Xanthobacteraceae bacterium]|jgi:serine/threonine-protein kinase RIO1
MEKLIRIEAPHFVAGIVIDRKNMVVDAAPILKWMIGRDVHDCLSYFEKQGYRVTTLKPLITQMSDDG